MERRHILGPVDGPAWDWVPEMAHERIREVVKLMSSGQLSDGLIKLRRAFLEMPKAAPAAAAVALDECPTPLRFELACLVLLIDREYPGMVADTHAATATNIIVIGLSDGDTSLATAAVMGRMDLCPAATIEKLDSMMRAPDERRIAAAAALSALVVRESEGSEKCTTSLDAMIRALEEGLTSNLLELGVVAAISLARLGVSSASAAEQAWRHIAVAADDRERYLVLHAMESVGVGDIRSVGWLTAYMKDQSNAAWLRGVAGRSLVRILGPAADHDIIDDNTANNGDIMSQMLFGIGGDDEGSKALLDVVLDWLQSTDDELRFIAMNVLSQAPRAADKARDALMARVGLESGFYHIEVLGEAILAARSIGVDELVKQYKSRNVLAMMVCGRALIHRGRDGLRAIILEAFREPEFFVRAAFVALIRDYGPGVSGVAEELGRLLDTAENEEIAVLIVQAIGTMGPAAAGSLPSLIRAIAGQRVGVALRAESVIRMIGPSAAGVVRSAIAAADGLAAFSLSRALQWIQPGDPKLLAAFIRIGAKKLVRVHYVGAIVRETGAQSWRDVPRRSVGCPGAAEALNKVKWGTLRRDCLALSAAVAGRHPLLRMRQGQAFEFTERGWRVLGALESYLLGIGALRQ